MLKIISIIRVSFCLLILLWSTSLFAVEKKNLSPAPPKALGEGDQTESKATSSGSSVAASVIPSNEEAADPTPLIPPPLQMQESFSSGG